jgi:hypothetical protein
LASIGSLDPAELVLVYNLLMTSAKSTIRFKATLKPVKEGAILSLPKSVNAKKAEGAINGLPFRANLQKNMLKINKAMYDFLGTDEVAVEITRVGEEAEIRIPADLRKALEAIPKAWATWEDITPISRRDWVFWYISGKKEETRKRHLEKARDMLSKGKRRVCCFAGINWMMKDYV